jgi:hypothetical protein
MGKDGLHTHAVAPLMHGTCACAGRRSYFGPSDAAVRLRAVGGLHEWCTGVQVLLSSKGVAASEPMGEKTVDGSPNQGKIELPRLGRLILPSSPGIVPTGPTTPQIVSSLFPQDCQAMALKAWMLPKTTPSVGL